VSVHARPCLYTAGCNPSLRLHAVRSSPRIRNRAVRVRNLPLSTRHAMLRVPVIPGGCGVMSLLILKFRPGIAWERSELSHEIQASTRAALRRLDFGRAGGCVICPRQDRQDRRDLSAERQRRECRRARPRRRSRPRSTSSTTRTLSLVICRWRRTPVWPGLAAPRSKRYLPTNQGSPAVGQNQALRLITEEKVVALNGAYQSGITLTASAILGEIRHSLRER